jgi:hypothetical protein
VRSSTNQIHSATTKPPLGPNAEKPLAMGGQPRIQTFQGKSDISNLILKNKNNVSNIPDIQSPQKNNFWSSQASQEKQRTNTDAGTRPLIYMNQNLEFLTNGTRPSMTSHNFGDENTIKSRSDIRAPGPDSNLYAQNRTDQQISGNFGPGPNESGLFTKKTGSAN